MSHKLKETESKEVQGEKLEELDWKQPVNIDLTTNWLDSSVVRALRRYRRVREFESRSSLNDFCQALIVILKYNDQSCLH